MLPAFIIGVFDVHESMDTGARVKQNYEQLLYVYS